MIAPAAFVGDPHDLGLTLSLNGTMKQDASTAGMIYRSISQFVTLEPGDIVLTGSPARVGLPSEFLRPGDKVVAAVEKIGDLRIEIAMSDSVYPRALTIPTR